MPQFLRLSSLGESASRTVRVAIIDSGVHASHPHVQRVAGGIGIDADGSVNDDYIDRLGHGTAVAAVIREKAPAAELFAVKVFDRDLSTTADALVAAIRWATTKRVHIINLSLGTNNPSHEAALQRELDAARAAGVFVVAAAEQDDVRWLPGSLRGAIAVEADMTLPRDTCEVVRLAGDEIRLRASGFPRPIPGVSPEKNLKGLSFAVANASGLLARALQNAPAGISIGDALAGVVDKSTSPSG